MEQRLSRSIHEMETKIDETLVIMNQIRPWLYMVLFAVLGMGTRTLIYYYFQKWKITSSYTAVFADLPCNFFGCFIMGLYVPSKNVWNTISPALSLGIGTGLCGCITTWSAWNLSITKLFLMGNYQGVDYGSYIGSAFFAIGIGICIAQGGLMLGKQCNALFFGSFNSQTDINPLEGKCSFIFVAISVICIYALGIFLIVFEFPNEATNKNNTDFTQYWYYAIALLVAPLGALLRWQLGANLNGKQWFPVGTIIANILGVLLDAVSDGYYDKDFGPRTLYAAQIASSNKPAAFAPGGNQFQNMLVVAFCGNLSTVSTWINELNSFNEVWKSWIYLIVHFLICQGIALPIYWCIYLLNNSNIVST